MTAVVRVMVMVAMEVWVIVVGIRALRMRWLITMVATSTEAIMAMATTLAMGRSVVTKHEAEPRELDQLRNTRSVHR